MKKHRCTHGDVTWMNCSECKTPWPFPNPTSPHFFDREWKCPVCIEAEAAKRMREAQAEVEKLRTELAAKFIVNQVLTRERTTEAGQRYLSAPLGPHSQN
jgi:hypothetical protein